MSKHSGPPLRKVTLNLYDRDCEILASYYGYGWSEQIRELVHQRVTVLRVTHQLPTSVADLTEDTTDAEEI